MSRALATAPGRPGNLYDRASRFLLRLDALPLLLWLLGARAAQVTFVGWLDTCGVPWALPIEVRIAPDPERFGRLPQSPGGIWLDVRPSPYRGDHFRVGAIVVNLTGKVAQLAQTAVRARRSEVE